MAVLNLAHETDGWIEINGVRYVREHPSPSPSLDYITVTFNGVDYVPRHALAAAQAEVERLRAMIVPGDAAAHEELLANLEESVRRANKVAADACVRSGENLRRAEAAERSLRDLASFARGNEVDRMSGDAAVVRDVLYGLWATLARLREPLMDEECGKLFMAYAQAPHDPGSTMRAVVREFLRVRGVQG